MWAWDFGDGTTDMVANPVHTYTSPGTYQVRLTASSQTCEPGISETTIRVTPKAIKADFLAEPRTGEAPLTVQFTDLSSGFGITSWVWDFGDGNNSTERNPKHTYLKEGTYQVSLTVSNGSYENTAKKPIGIR